MTEAQAQPDAVDIAELLRTQHGNDLAKHPTVRPIVRQWLAATCPLVYVFGPSGSGKTSLAGGLMKHPDYRPTLLIGIESGDTTIGEWTSNEAVCTRRVFEGEPAQQRAWIYEQLDAAADVDCSAIVIEGLAGWHKLAVARSVRSAPSAQGNALKRLYIEPSSRTSSVIGAIYDLKLTRRARGRSCPILVTLNTKEVGPDDAKELVPGLSTNLIEQAMQNAEAFLELRRSPTLPPSTTLLTMQNPRKHKLRHAAAAALIESQINLTLPGMFALWALSIHTRADDLSKRLTGY